MARSVIMKKDLTKLENQRKVRGKVLGLTEELGWHLTESEKQILLQQILFRLGLIENEYN